MAKSIKTNIICYDDHRGFTFDVRKRFSDSSRYKVVSFPTREEFINHLKVEKVNNIFKIAILGAHDTIEQFEMINELANEIKMIDPQAGLIILCPPDRMEEIRETIKFNIDAYIPKNTNAVLRIHNIVKKLISEHNISIFRRRRNFSLYVLLAFILLSAILILIAWFRLPQYF